VVVIVPLSWIGPLQVRLLTPLKAAAVTTVVAVKFRVRLCPAPVVEPVKEPE
jgi:hypothetical protein